MRLSVRLKILEALYMAAFTDGRIKADNESSIIADADVKCEGVSVYIYRIYST